MTRIVQCVKLKKEAEGLERPPYPGALGQRIWESISREAWEEWLSIQTRLVNENRLNLADARARKYLTQQMERHLFEDSQVEAHGFVPPSA
ncbi:oxidative damage protection protein [Kerstersia gyiorum]|jgi:Fe-S cluster biosynthesis and repair protein YggX|uniref:Probable Fe(2+)-trafficking protein n=1 Tax=Kerstersia gyiorum TaxID=206506 RepID=A0A171KNR1_9BURK|nr:oxidative damage protection protein [Kerstersia gyiorum]AZV94192.1 oxidative damage protection protein [Bordetella sp. J329]MCO7640565.1 oxidative damage protection protein [Pseudomonas sp. S 311-6]KAB0541703.1 oxidative damage protection protein [Kerstersia gyiorum]KKO70528.1 iron transporter [Kerstersia gyiorum]MCH4270742.1 oxidative damage protection protein [Kerstersia gyiorum]